MSKAETGAKMFAGAALAFFGACVFWVAAKPTSTGRPVLISPSASIGQESPAHRRSVGARKAADPVRQSDTRRTYFRNCTEMRKVYPRGVPRGHEAYRSVRDRDRDGYACERD